jgi:hypothetical protein
MYYTKVPDMQLYYCMVYAMGNLEEEGAFAFRYT